MPITRGSSLLHLDNIYDQEDRNDLTEISKEKRYAFTVLYRMVYFRFCDGDNLYEFLQFCDNINLYIGYSDNSNSNVLKSTEDPANENHLFGLGILSDHVSKAKLTCQSVQNYFDDN